MRIEEIEDSRRLELLIHGVVDYAIYTIDLEGNIVSWNSGAERLKGYTANGSISGLIRAAGAVRQSTVDYSSCL